MWWLWKGSNPDPAYVAFMNKNYPPDWTYQDFAEQFRAEFYGKSDHSSPNLYQKCYLPLDPNEWADIIAASGAKYVQLITLYYQLFSFRFT
jgi:alpha-L-fucosidase